jgi:predicted amidohydrolase
VSSASGRRFTPADVQYTPSSGDFEYATELQLLAAMIDACGNDAGRMTLLLSTCRNQWLTVNAIFVDLKLVLGARGARPDVAGGAIAGLRSPQGDADRKIRSAIKLADDALKLTDHARQKKDVWIQRARLATLLDDQIEALQDGLQRSRMEAWLERQRQGTRGDVVPWKRPYIALCAAEDGTCAAWLGRLHTCECAVTAAMRIVRHAGRLLLDDEVAAAEEPLAEPLGLFDLEPFASATAEAEMGAARSAEAELGSQLPSQTWEHLIALLRQAAPVLSVIAEDAGDAIVLQLADARRLSVPVAMPDAGEMRTVLDVLIEVAERAIDGARAQLQEQFVPNVAVPPLPEPFEIDLTTHEPSSGRRARRFDVRTYLASGEPTPDVAMIALLDCPMPERAYSHVQPELYIYDHAEGGASAARSIASNALQHAREAGAQLLVMPEVFLPRGSVDELVEQAQSLEIGLIAGVEYPHSVVGTAVNEAVISLPTLSYPLKQRKQAPSVFEMRRANFANDDILHLVRRTPFGTVATVICSDFMELDHLWAVVSQDHPIDLLVVCARNRRPDVFHRLAIADSIRLHAYVAVANAHSEWSDELAAADDAAPERGIVSGSVIAQPSSRKKPFVETQAISLPPAAGLEVPSRLLVGELNVANIRARDRERAGSSGFLPPPRFPRWQPADPRDDRS